MTYPSTSDMGDTVGATLGTSADREVDGMTKIATLTDEELRARREQIIARLGISLEELRDRAAHYALVGDEHDVWEQLESIAFLLGETRT